ncbi:MAG: methylmalonyl Co-A mutase-associated GTPase MeaB [Alphaproteobacteria bacterium]
MADGAGPAETASLADAVRAGDRRALARAITLVESTRADHRAHAAELLTALLPHTGGGLRVGITGVPGVGKSTFIEALGAWLVDAGHRVAVLAVDPSSRLSGGSILGDKTRMTDLSRSPAAFIRPSPTAGTLGGVARRTREAMLVCEAAGYDTVLVETVGVGQSETAVAGMVDLFLLLLLPSGGDALQGVKRGIMELADLVVVNKADGDLAAAAERTAAEYANAIRMLRPPSPPWAPEVLSCSAQERRGIDAVWGAAERFRAVMGGAGALARKRAAQARDWMWSEVEETLTEAFRAHPAVAARLPALEEAVATGRMAPSAAALELLGLFRGPEAGR